MYKQNKRDEDRVKDIVAVINYMYTLGFLLLHFILWFICSELLSEVGCIAKITESLWLFKIANIDTACLLTSISIFQPT